VAVEAEAVGAEHHVDDERGHDSDPDDPVDSLEGMLPDDGLDMPDLPALELDFDDDADDA